MYASDIMNRIKLVVDRDKNAKIEFVGAWMSEIEIKYYPTFIIVDRDGAVTIVVELHRQLNG